MDLYGTPDGIFSQLEKLPSTTTPDLNKNIGGSTDLARKYGSTDLHTYPYSGPSYYNHFVTFISKVLVIDFSLEADIFIIWLWYREML